MEDVDAASVNLLREVLAATEWVRRSREFGRALRSTRSPGGLLIVGTPEEEPWHVTAHLADESRLSGLPQLAPTLIRWRAPPGAPPHLSVTLDRLSATRRGETLFVVAEAAAPARLLERVSDARRIGATVLALDGGDPDLESLAHDAMAVSPDNGALDFDGAQHLVSAAAGEHRRGLRDRLARLLESVSGPRLEE